MGADALPRAAVILAAAHAVLLAIVYTRPGLAGVFLWNIGRPLLTLADALVLGAILFISWRGRLIPTRRHLAAFAALAAAISALVMLRTYPSSHDSRPSAGRFRLPLDGPVTVAWGGPSTAVNYHAVIPDQRWAYDLLVARNGRSFRNDGTRLDDYFAYGQPVLAPADAVVHSVRDSEPDEPIGHWQVRRATGNHVVLEVAPREFLFIAHLQPGSISVRPGEHVTAGQAIGRVGNSGNASEPHVHLHLQDTPTPYLGEGIPLYFHNYRVNGRLVERGMPTGGRERRSRMWPGRFTGQVVEQLRWRSTRLGYPTSTQSSVRSTAFFQPR